jgi:hypothetical protein
VFGTVALGKNCKKNKSIAHDISLDNQVMYEMLGVSMSPGGPFLRYHWRTVLIVLCLMLLAAGRHHGAVPEKKVTE